MLPLVLVFAFVSVSHANVISRHVVFTNVAYSKPVSLSSKYLQSEYPGSNAVNGLISDFTHTLSEKYPWLRIDLGAVYYIHEIEVFARSDCCGNILTLI